MEQAKSPLAQYERWFTSHEKKKIKQEQPVAPKPTEEPLPDNVVYVDFKARKRIK